MAGSAAGRGDRRGSNKTGAGASRGLFATVPRAARHPRPSPSMQCFPSLVLALSSLLGALALLQLSLYLRVPSRYGKHEERLCRPRGRLPARCAWFLQELPSFLVPALLLALRNPPRLEPLGCRLLCCLFCWHYFYRYRRRAGLPHPPAASPAPAACPRHRPEPPRHRPAALRRRAVAAESCGLPSGIGGNNKPRKAAGMGAAGAGWAMRLRQVLVAASLRSVSDAVLLMMASGRDPRPRALLET